MNRNRAQEVFITTNPRSSPRRPLHLMIKGRVQSRSIYATLIDISEGGCKISATNGFANVGDRVTMCVDGINTPLGKIVWEEGKVAGISFDSPMHIAMIDHLCANARGASDDDRQHTRRL